MAAGVLVVSAADAAGRAGAAGAAHDAAVAAWWLGEALHLRRPDGARAARGHAVRGAGRVAHGRARPGDIPGQIRLQPVGLRVLRRVPALAHADHPAQLRSPVRRQLRPPGRPGLPGGRDRGQRPDPADRPGHLPGRADRGRAGAHRLHPRHLPADPAGRRQRQDRAGRGYRLRHQPALPGVRRDLRLPDARPGVLRPGPARGAHRHPAGRRPGAGDRGLGRGSRARCRHRRHPPHHQLRARRHGHPGRRGCAGDQGPPGLHRGGLLRGGQRGPGRAVDLAGLARHHGLPVPRG